ncbi:MAG: efflux transporter outer membrane subunit [Desulfobulbus sp.]|nr:efflux transporter outer membrane subunit [Desulfobulbus sp.]
MFTSASKHIVASALIALLGGCAIAPEYTRPDMPVAGQLPSVPGLAVQSGATPATPVVGAELGWRDFFTDAQLQTIIETALSNNRDLRVSALNIASYQAQYRIQRSALFPSISGSGSGTKQRTYSGSNHVTLESYSASVGISSYELDFFGRVRSLKDQALEQYLAMEETHRSARISLVAEVAGAYLTWLTDKELLAITEDTKQTEEESYQLVEQRANEGMSTQLDLAQARTSLETARANLALYQRQVAQDVNNLGLLTGASLPHLKSGDRGVNDQVALAMPPARLSSALLLQRPDIQAAEHTLKGANAQVGAARAAFFPSISLTASAGKISGDLSNLFDSNSGAWLFTPSINLPIFTAGRLQAELDVAKISKDISVANYELAIQTAFREVADALVAGETYDRQLVAQKANLAANQEYYTLAKERYQQGLDSFLTLLDAQRSLYTARQSCLTLQLTQRLNRINLYKVLGGGWKERTLAVDASSQAL